jgi:ribonuclease BN (tRNA processing enzyme)
LNDIQSAFEEKIDQVDKLINEFDKIAEFNRTKISDAMACLRQTIDEHEQELLTQISRVEIEQKNQIEEYKTRWKHEPQNLSMQKAALKILLATKNYTKLLNVTQEFEDYIKRTNEILKTMSIPVPMVYELKGLDRVEVTKTEILQCGKFVTNNNSQERQEHYLDPTNVSRIILTGDEFPNDMVLRKHSLYD